MLNKVHISERLSWSVTMSSLKLQKRLAADVMKCGKKKVSDVVYPDFYDTFLLVLKWWYTFCTLKYCEGIQAQQGWHQNAEIITILICTCTEQKLYMKADYLEFKQMLA